MSRSVLVWRALGFLAVFTVLQSAWQAAIGTWLEDFVIHTCTVKPAAFLVNLLTPFLHAQAVHSTIRAPGGGLNIINGCDGLEALFLLSAAFMVAPAPWRLRLAGLGIGVLVVFVLNQARILALFYAYRSDHSLFDLLHATITPIAVILLVAAYFYAWLAFCSRRAPIPV